MPTTQDPASLTERSKGSAQSTAMDPQTPRESQRDESLMRVEQPRKGAVARVVSDYPWMTMGAAVAAGAALGVSSRRIMDSDNGDSGFLSSAAGSVFSLARSLLWRSALVPLTRKVIDVFDGNRGE